MATIAEMLAAKKKASEVVKTETHPATATETISTQSPIPQSISSVLIAQSSMITPAKKLTGLAAAMAGRKEPPLVPSVKPITLGNVLAKKKELEEKTPAVETVSPSTGVAVDTEDTAVVETEEEDTVDATAVDTSSVSHFNHPTQPDAMPASIEEDLKRSLDIIKLQFEDRALVGQAIPHIMRSLQENPNLRALLAPEDIGLMVRGLRECYGVAVTVKVEKKAKKETVAKEKSEIGKELDGLFNELGMSK